MYAVVVGNFDKAVENAVLLGEGHWHKTCGQNSINGFVIYIVSMKPTSVKPTDWKKVM